MTYLSDSEFTSCLLHTELHVYLLSFEDRSIENSLYNSTTELSHLIYFSVGCSVSNVSLTIYCNFTAIYFKQAETVFF